MTVSRTATANGLRNLMSWPVRADARATFCALGLRRWS
jgi:hypothetical protein